MVPEPPHTRRLALLVLGQLDLPAGELACQPLEVGVGPDARQVGICEQLFETVLPPGGGPVEVSDSVVR